MKISDAFGVDEKLEEEGTWVPLGTASKLKIARFGNAAHRKCLDRLRKPYRNLILAGQELPDEVSENLTCISVAETILKGWEGIEDENGEPLEFTPGNCLRIVSEYKDFREFIVSISMEASQFRTAETEAIAGN